MKTRIMFVFCMLVFVSCDKENSRPADEFTLKSSEYTRFLFEMLGVITFPNSNNLKVDFVMSPQTTENGDVVSPQRNIEVCQMGHQLPANQEMMELVNEISNEKLKVVFEKKHIHLKTL
ncbi:MAG: hypothetical protein PHW91_10215 [Bacteroidales bacterium]|nr:hypothetical protein [Bacteroidales bacterium]